MSDNYFLDVVYNVLDTRSKCVPTPCIKVGPDPEGLNYVRMSTDDKASREWFGEINVIMDPKMARLLAKALNRAADDADAAGAGTLHR